MFRNERKKRVWQQSRPDCLRRVNRTFGRVSVWKKCWGVWHTLKPCVLVGPVLPRKFLFDRPFSISSKPVLAKSTEQYSWILVVPVPLVCKSSVVSRTKSQTILLSWTVTSDVVTLYKLRIKWVWLSRSPSKSWRPFFTAVLGLARDFWEHGKRIYSQANQTKNPLCCSSLEQSQ